MLPDIIVGVTNLLVKQALNLLKKEEIDTVMKLEIETILNLCTPQQQGTIKTEVDKFDGRQKRIANKVLQDIAKGK